MDSKIHLEEQKMGVRKLQVLEIVASSRGGGAEHVFCIAKGIDKSKFDLTIIMPEDDGNVNAFDFERLGIKVVPFNFFNRLSLREFLNFWSFIRRGDFDIVHCHGARAALFGRLAASLLRRWPKIVYTIHGFHVIHYQNPIKKICLLLLERILGHFTDMIICVSHSDRESVIKTKIAKSDKIKIIWNGIDLERFQKVLLNNNVKRNELGLPADAFILTMIGRLHPPKDLFTLITSFQLVQDELPNTCLLIVGDGPLRKELQNYAKRLHLNSKIIFAGARRDIPEILAITDIFILSTLWEGLPIVLLEAMASAKPVIASDICGNKEVVVNGETGILVPPIDPKSLAKAIIELARDPQKAKRLGQKGIARVKENFTLEKMIQQVTNLYEELTR
jgi:glycosyltransferase involved in cell wall biosynthesis